MTFFDGHNDLLLNLWLNYSSNPTAFFSGIEQGHLDFPRIQRAGLIGGIFAIFIPPKHYIAEKYPQHAEKLSNPLAVMWEQLAILKELVNLSNGRVKLCTSAAELYQCKKNNVFAVIAHIEGADALAVGSDMLNMFYEAGVRSLGPFWNTPNIYGEGVTGGFPGSPDSGSALTSAGKELITQLSDKRMLIDCSHMNEKTFWQVATLSKHPLVATHSSVHQLCAQPRNLTDQQLLAIRDSGGVVGINFGNAFIRPDGLRSEDTDIEVLVDHFLYVLTLIGDDHLAFGSDFDGVSVPKSLKDVTGLPLIVECLMKRGVSEKSIEKISHKNWFRVLESTWGQ
ncbi:dipeptidase [Rosenbergiella australiborealis]|uniref:Membrane dipeptidase n=1 Tax=Rosenbergiella australiborealis TaxID=1544696 RepID=A0ABS5T792_9GAMM|nr:dipeptidase [Rosenbergiella australiborealis]MBT0728216.1 membrane dipeptidase [Rosenbergiella australiborealis]